jgi:CheY-like chemotaxis protein
MMSENRSLAILVADDDAVTRMVVAGMLRRGGHAVDTAIDGLEAVEAAARRRYDLILMDLQMPELDGLEAARRIRSGVESPTRIVLLTATIDDGLRRRCAGDAIDAIIEKPLDADAVATLVGNTVDSIADGARDARAHDPEDLSDETFERLRSETARSLSRPFAEVIASMLASMREQSERLRTAVEASDRDAIRRAAHALRGSSATIGAERLSHRMRELEARAVELPPEALVEAAVAARDELARVEGLVAQRAERG